MTSEKTATAAGGIQAPERTHNATSNAGAENNHSQDGDNVSLVDHGRDEKTAAGPTKFQKIKAHFWRFKWWYLLALVIVLAILLPIL